MAFKRFPGEEMPRRARADALTTKFIELTQQGVYIQKDPEWEEFVALVPFELSIDLQKGASRNRYEAKVKTIISECTAPLLPNEGAVAVGLRTNILLGAILLKLHGIADGTARPLEPKPERGPDVPPLGRDYTK